MTSEVAYDPPRVSLHDGNGRRLCELVAAMGKRAYRTMTVSRATFVIAETDEYGNPNPQLEKCDPREGRFLVVESELYGLMWAGQLVGLEGGPVAGTVSLEARSYEGVLQERFLPTDFAPSGSAGAVFRALWEAVERENSTGVTLDANIAAGSPFDSTNYGDRNLFDAWNLVAQQTAHEWWLEHEVVKGQLQTSAHFRPARGQDRTGDVSLVVGPWANVRVNRWRISTEGATHRLRAVAGATSATQAFSERSRVERRGGKSSPVSTATLVTTESTRHGYAFGRWPTGDSVLTRGERLAVLENVRGAGALSIAAEAALSKGRRAQRVIELEVQGAGQLWRYCQPGDVVTLDLPAPYFIDGYRGPVAILDTEPWEEAGTMRLNIEVPNE